MDVEEFLSDGNISCYGASRVNLSSYWKELYQPSFAGEARTVALLLIFLTGIPLNLYIIIAILYKRLYTQPTYLLLLNLGFVDLFACFVPIAFGIVTGHRREISLGSSDYIRCQACKIISGYIIVVSLQSFTVSLLSMERLVFFVSPLRYRNSVTARKTGLMLAIVWLLSFALMMPPIYGYGDLTFAMWCGYIFLTPPHASRSLVYLCLMAVLGATQMVFIVISNVWIGCIAFKSMKMVKGLRITPNPSQATRIMHGDIAVQRAAYNRKMSREVASKQLRFFQVFGGLLLVNILTILPAIILLVAVAVKLAVPGEYVAFVQIVQMSQVVLHPAVETSIAPELRKVIVSHCRICPTKVRYTRVGKCLYKAYFSLSRWCRADLWTNALEKQLVNIYEFSMEEETMRRSYSINSKYRVSRVSHVS